MTSLREAQGHCISMLTFSLWKEAYCQSYGKSCGAFTGCGNTHTLVDFKALVTLTSPLLHITLHPHLCLLSEFTSILCQARYFQFAPVLCGLEERQCPGCEP